MKAIPVMLIGMIWKLAKLTNAPLRIAIAQLVNLAFFFAMRNCEYSKTSSKESKRTMYPSFKVPRKKRERNGRKGAPDTEVGNKRPTKKDAEE